MRQRLIVLLAVLVGVLAASLRACVTASAERQFRRPLWRRLALGRAAVDLLRESGTVGRRLIAAALGADRRPGRFVHRGFEARGEHAETATRRAEAVFVVSLAPNSYVVDRVYRLLLGAYIFRGYRRGRRNAAIRDQQAGAA